MTVGPITISPVNMDERKRLGIRAGDTVRVQQKIIEKSEKDGKPKVRLQAFEGLVLAVKHGSEAGGTFTVRKIVDRVGVERIFPLYSPMVDKIEIIKRSRVHRAKLYHIREKAAKEIRKEMKNELRVVPPVKEKSVTAETEEKAVTVEVN